MHFWRFKMDRKLRFVHLIECLLTYPISPLHYINVIHYLFCKPHYPQRYANGTACHDTKNLYPFTASLS
jgi:hypothetical protein